jgi:predicted nuclease with TOPRIM domain
MDEINEAFRVEIDSLNAENAHLKQIGRERDRELADQRDKIEELTGKIGIFERERNAWTNTVCYFIKLTKKTFEIENRD